MTVPRLNADQYLICITSNPEEVFTPSWMQTMLPCLADQHHEVHIKMEWVVQLGDLLDDAVTDRGTGNLLNPGSLRQWLNQGPTGHRTPLPNSQVVSMEAVVQGPFLPS